MGISNFTLSRIFNELVDSISGSKIERVSTVAENVYILSVFKERRYRSLLLSLDPSLPLMLKSDSYAPETVLPSDYGGNLLRKYLEKATILRAEKISNDRIVFLDVRKWTPSYQLLETRIIFELFPLSPNVIFTDRSDVILDAFKHSESLDSKHPIFRGLHYDYPKALNKEFSEDTPLEEMKGKVNKSEFRYLETLSREEYKIAIRNMFQEKKYYYRGNDVSSLKFSADSEYLTMEELFLKILDRKKYEYKENRYQKIFRLVEQKTKSAKKKLINLERDKERFEHCEEYLEKGNLLYLGNDLYHRGDTAIVIEGIEIELDPRYDLHENAQRYFKLYKKSKSGLVQIEIQKQRAMEESDYFERLNHQLKFASASDMEEIILDLCEHRYIKEDKIQNRAKKKPGNHRYTPHIVKINGVKIGYGLSSYQNEELTFRLASKDDIYLHIKDYHGPHVILFESDPKEDSLLLSGEIALYFAGKTTGEVYYTPKRNVKKVPGQRGLVVMSTQNVMVIHQIRSSTLDALRKL